MKVDLREKFKNFYKNPIDLVKTMKKILIIILLISIPSTALPPQGKEESFAKKKDRKILLSWKKFVCERIS